MTRATDVVPGLGADSALETSLARMLQATDREDQVAFLDELSATEDALRAAGTPRWTAWSHALVARRRLIERDAEGAAAEVALARALLADEPASAEAALQLAYLSHVEIAADRFDAGMHLAVDSSLIAEGLPPGRPERALHQAHHWLSLALTRLDLEELAVAQALRGHRVAVALGDPADRWQLLRLCAQQHMELAQTVHRRGDTARSRQLAAVALRCVHAAHGLDWTPGEHDRDLLAVVHAWALTLAGNATAAAAELRRARARVRATGGLWLLGFADLALARVLAAAAASHPSAVHQSDTPQAGPLNTVVGPDGSEAGAAGPGAEATDLLVDASGAFAAIGDRRRYRQCLLELGQTTALLGNTGEALHWLEAYRAESVRAHLRGRELWAEMFVRRSRLREAERQADLLRRHALEDPLTSLGNRRSAERRLAELHLTDGPVSLAIVDVDRFKDVNDQNSHLHGDAVLRRVADLLRQHCRTGDEVYRWAGDEFLVVLPSATEAQAASAMERLRSAVAGADWTELGLSVDVSVSIGVATATPGLAAGATGWRALFDTADLHLFSAKRSGRNRVRAATPGDVVPQHPGRSLTDRTPLTPDPADAVPTVDEMVDEVLGAPSSRRPSGWAFAEDESPQSGHRPEDESPQAESQQREDRSLRPGDRSPGPGREPADPAGPDAGGRLSGGGGA